MSVATNEERTGCCDECEEHDAVSRATPQLPIVAFGAEHGLRVYTHGYAAVAAAFAHPDQELYDSRGIELTRLVTEDGTPCLEALGDEQPDDVRERVLATLRELVECADIEPCDVDDIRTMFAWLCEAPTLKSLLLASDAVAMDFNVGRPCTRGCVAWAMIINPNCCRT